MEKPYNTHLRRNSATIHDLFPIEKRVSSPRGSLGKNLRDSVVELQQTQQLHLAHEYSSKSKSSDLNQLFRLSDNKNFFFKLTHPSLLSEIAWWFRENVSKDSHSIDSVEYKDCFTGTEAVDTISNIIASSDRSLSLSVGKILLSHGFIYNISSGGDLVDSNKDMFRVKKPTSTFKSFASYEGKGDRDETLPTGVLTAQSNCYSYTCKDDLKCYSSYCPRIKEIVLETSIKAEDTAAEEKLWYKTVPADILNNVSSTERKRQEILFEIIQTEKQFLEDLQTVQNVFVKPLLENNIIEEGNRQSFVNSVFLNMNEILQINSKLKRKLLARQRENYVIHSIGDIFAIIAEEWYVFVEYGAGQAFAKYLLDEEKNNNAIFAQFLKECERKKECRKLSLESFLSRPTTRMGRYPLFLTSSISNLPLNHPDSVTVPQALSTIRDILKKINFEAGKAENALKLSKLDTQILFTPGEEVDLDLKNEKRKLIREGVLYYRKPSGDLELSVFLFDHFLLMAKKKQNDTYKVFRTPIPLQLILFKHDSLFAYSSNDFDKTSPRNTRSNSVRSSVSSMNSPINQSLATNKAPANSQSFTFVHLGRNGGLITLATSSVADKLAWMDSIQSQRSALIDSSKLFDLQLLSDDQFKISSRVNCSVSYSGMLVIGTDDGLYVGLESCDGCQTHRPIFKKVLDKERIFQVDILPDYDMLIILSDRILFSFSLDILTNSEKDNFGAMKKGKKIGSNVSFFKLGVCSERTLISAVKSSSLSATIKLIEPVGLGGNKLKGKFGRLFKAVNDTLRVYKEFYIPTESRSIHFLRTKLCVSCSKGFEIVDLDTLDTQSLLDMTDPKLEFLKRWDGLARPVAIFRIKDGEFFLCYNEFGFFVNQLGLRYREDYLVFWTGYPTSFAYVYPYILAFEPTYIEVRRLFTGEICQIIPTNNLRALNTNTDYLHFTYDQYDFQVIAKVVLISEDES